MLENNLLRLTLLILQINLIKMNRWYKNMLNSVGREWCVKENKSLKLNDRNMKRVA